MIAEAGAAIGGIKVAMDMAKGIAALKSEAEINQAIIDIQRILLDAQTAALADKESISDLRDQITKLQSELNTRNGWNDEKARYVLTKSPKGAYTYNLRTELESEVTPHKICSNCFDQDQKSVLQTIASGHGGELVECPRCKSRFELSEFHSTPIQYDRNVY